MIVLVSRAEAVSALDEWKRRKVFRGGVLRPHVVGIGDAEILVEAVIRRQELLVIAEVPLSEHGGGVALGLEKFREERLLRVDADTAAWSQGPIDADAVGVATGEKAGSGRRADRLGSIPLGKLSPFSRHAVEMRCFVTLSAIDANIAIALVVCENDDDIGRAFLSKGGKEAGSGEGQNSDDFAHKKGWKRWGVFISYGIDQGDSAFSEECSAIP